MKVPKRVKEIADQIAKNAEKQRRLNTELAMLLEKMGVADNDDLVRAIAHLECDCDTKSFIDYLEYDL